MKVTKIKVLENEYYIGFDSIGITFIGSPNASKDEINKWFGDLEYVYSNDLNEVKNELELFLEGKKKAIDTKFNMIGTDFQKSVWNELIKIPYGETRTYKEIAENLGDVKKVRAVATAIAKNPLLLIVPCHRVIGSDGKLRGFRAGLDFKEVLLSLEDKMK